MKGTPVGRFWISALGLLALGMGFKALLLGLEAFPFNADEAVVGLMARHILAGAWPAFFYGQAYMGSLDATAVALFFRIFGESVLGIRIVQCLLYGGTILTTVMLGRRLYQAGPAPLIAGLLMAIPTVNVTLYTTVSLGGYGEALLIGNLLLILTLELAERPGERRYLMLWGMLAGLGFWAFGLTLVYSIPAGMWLVRSIVRNRGGAGAYLSLAAGAILGASPWLWSALEGGAVPFLQELSGSAIAGASPSNLPATVLAHSLNLLVLGITVIFGFRPPWEVRALAWPLLPIAAAFWLAASYWAIKRLARRDRARAGRALLAGVAATLLLGFVLTPFGADPSGRYFLPLAAPLALLAGDMLAGLKLGAQRRMGFLGLAAVLGFNLWGTLESALRNPPGITTQFNPASRVDHSHIDSLMDFLEGEGELRGYTNYWVSYPLAFLSDERLIYVAQLPYRQDLGYTNRDDRYPPYDRAVQSSPEVAYISTNHPALDDRIRQALDQHGLGWRETRIGDYRVFYDLTGRMNPTALDLGAGAVGE